jgi:vitamin K-dependent gamma-carboxylase
MPSQAVNTTQARSYRVPPRSRRDVLAGRLFAPVDVASLVFFRVAFGAIMFWEVCRYFAYGWVERFYIEPEFFFTYYGFGWVRPWPGDWMYVHFLALGVLAVFIALGFLYRASMALFFAGFTHVFLLDQTNYLNHFYLICLLSFIMVFVPAHRAFSVDAWLRPSLRSSTAPAWALVLVAAQVAVVYFYGGLAKLNGDWLRGEPMRMWLADDTGFPLIGPLFTREWVVYAFSYGGLLLDLLVVPFLLWRKTRVFAFAAALTFHLLNSQLFNIGIFPWFMIAATLLFFSPSWPRRLVDRLRGAGPSGRPGPDAAANSAAAGRLRPAQYAVLGCLALYLLVQLLVPLRHHLYPGNVSWTEEGHRFSWHMKLRDKEARARFVIVDPARGVGWRVDKREYVNGEQAHEMSSEPDMILQFAHRVAEDLRAQGRDDLEVRAIVQASLNGREFQPLVDPGVDLASQPRTLMPAGWIVPLEKPLVPEDRSGARGPGTQLQ